MSTFKVSLYLYHNVLPKRKIYMYRCMNTPCQRPLFKYTADNLVVANSGATNFTQYEPGAHYIEVKCHSCGAEYRVLFQ